MERRQKNWGTLVYTLRSATRKNPLFRSSPNLSTSSRAQLSDDDDDYGFITKPPPPIPEPPIPPLPLEFQEEYQKRLKELQNKAYWESIKAKLTEYYSHQYHQQLQQQQNHHYRQQRGERVSFRRGSHEELNKPMETDKNASSFKSLKNKQNSVTQSVPLQSSLGLDDNWISSSLERQRRDSGSTSELLDQVCEVQDCCERFEDFRDEDDLRKTPLCVKCLVRYYNNRPITDKAIMSRVSLMKCCCNCCCCWYFWMLKKKRCCYCC